MNVQMQNHAMIIVSSQKSIRAGKRELRLPYSFLFYNRIKPVSRQLLISDSITCKLFAMFDQEHNYQIEFVIGL